MKQTLTLISLLFFMLVAFTTFAQVDLTNSRIAVCLGTSHDQYATKHYPNSKIIRAENNMDIFTMLTTNKADYAIFEAICLKELVNNENNIIVLDSAFYSMPSAIAFRPKDKKLITQFNNFLRQIKDNGIHQQMVDRWMNKQNSVLPDIKTSGKELRIGTNSNIFPFAYIKDNHLIGFDIELMLRFGESNGYKIIFDDMNYSAMVTALMSNKIDAIAASLNTTEERKKQVAFSDPYIEESSALFTVDRDPKQKFIMPNIVGGTIEDTVRTIIGQDKIAAVEGTIQELFLSKTLPNAQLMVAKDHSDSFLMLNSKNASYILCNIGVASEYIRTNPDTEIILSHLLPANCCYAVAKDNSSLKDELNQYIAKTNTDSLYKYWFANLSNGKMPDIDLSKNTEVLRVGSGANSPPFNFIVNKEYRGLDFDILTRFCQATGRRMEIIEMPFSSLIASLSIGKIDIIANSLVDTKERKRSVDFTIPYTRNYSVIIRSNKNIEVASKGVWNIFKDAFYNNIVAEKRYILILDGLWKTIILSVFSILLGTVIGGVICYLRMRKNSFLSAFGRVYVDIMRGIPVLVLLMMNYYVIFAELPVSATLVAIISFAMNFGAYVSEMFRGSINGIDKGQQEAGIAMGFTPTQTFINIIAPQAIARVLPIFKGEAISLVKMTSIVGYVAVQDLTKVSDIIRSRTFDAFFPLVLIAIIYFLLAIAFTKLLDLITSKYIKK